MISLSGLARQLGGRAAPVLVSDLIEAFVDAEALTGFLELVREYTPEALDQVKAAPGPTARVMAFAAAFERRWFPLNCESEELEDHQQEGDSPYNHILMGIPVYFMGVSYDDWESIPDSSQDGNILLSAVCAACFDDPDNPYGESGRVALLEAVAALVGLELAQRVPEGGYSLAEIQERVAGTRFQALATLSGILNKDTDNDWLDISQDEFYEAYGGTAAWDHATVEALAGKFKEAEDAWDAVRNLCVLMEQDPGGRFRELLNLLEGRPAVPKEQLPLPLIEVFGEEKDERE